MQKRRLRAYEDGEERVNEGRGKEDDGDGRKRRMRKVVMTRRRRKVGEWLKRRTGEKKCRNEVKRGRKKKEGR